MNPRLFDTLARRLASRRVALRSGTALVLGMAQRGQLVEAGCKSVGGKCRRKKCCTGARCKHGRCRCKTSSPEWAGVCCKDRFALANGPGLQPLPGTEFCCAAEGVCAKDDDSAHDDCCQENETCLNGTCCCDGCRETVICGGVCCSSASCCNGSCCAGGQVCAETVPGIRSCVPATRDCDVTADCYPGEECWGGTCCTSGRTCVLTNGPGPDTPTCCGTNTYCDAGLGTCCSNGNVCTTGKKVRIRV